MAFGVLLEPGEEILVELDEGFGKDHSESPLVLVLTNQRALWPGKKLFAVTDAVTTESVPVAQVSHLSWERPGAASLWAVSVVLLVLGVLWTLSGKDDALVIGMPTMMILVAPFYPLLGRKKRVLRLQGPQATLVWKSPVVFGAAANATLKRIEDELLHWCKKTGVRMAGAGAKPGAPS